MRCKHCGCYASDEAIVCPDCGNLLQFSITEPAGGAEAIRQGKRAREAARNPAVTPTEEIRRKRRSGASRATLPLPKVKDTRAYGEDPAEGQQVDEPAYGEDADIVERRSKPVYSDEIARERQAAAYVGRSLYKHKPMINWVKVALITVGTVAVVAVCGWLFLTKTEPGQKLMARLGQETTSAALWRVGEEKMDNGDIPGAILDFEKAKAQDEANEVVDVDGLLMLGNAYEAAGQVEQAAQLYENIYTETPSRPEAYKAHIRILLTGKNAGDQARAGELMELAYIKTGDASFSNQRRDLLPAPPEVDLTAGYYETKKYISITSYQGYDVYYTFDENAVLPAGGTLFTERVFLDEGIHTLRAVAVNGELVSDELHGTYKIIMPSPQTPRTSLAPNTYKNRQRVWLKPGLDNENDDDIVIFYTIDGSNPDADSPVYTGEPFWLPGGRVTLKAVAVNKYNKVSNMLERLYKIEAKPYPLTGLVPDDLNADIRLYSTTNSDFEEKYGKGTLEGNVTLEGLDTECRKYTYPWGYMITSRVKSGWVVAEVYYRSNGIFSAIRGTQIDDSLDFVIGKFRDMGQVESPSGNRGLYANSDGTGKIWVREEGKIIRYMCYTEDSHRWQLEYYVNKNGTVEAIDLRYLP